MASVDDIFRTSRTGIAPKRKLEDPTSTSSYRSQPTKSAKLTNGATPHSSHTNSLSRAAAHPPPAATVEDEPPPEDDEDTEAGPSLAPTDDIPEDPDEDTEGRFFGGGVTQRERQALDFLDQNRGTDDDDVQAEEVYDQSWLRRTAVGLQKKIERNSTLRTRYADQPQKFIESEADLDDELKGLSILSEHTELYGDFAKTAEGGAESLVNLLSHENSDIAMRAVQVLAELTDEDTGADEPQWRAIVQTLLKSGVVELLVSNLGRLDETQESDREGVYHVLELLENLCSSSDTSSLDTVGREPHLLPWLLTRIQTPDPESPNKVSQNRQYAAELLAIFLQGSPKLRQSFTGQLNGVDPVLQLLSNYRKRDPDPNSDEEEFAENLFDCLAVLVDDADGTQKFLEGEGVELCLILLREGRFSKTRALKVLDHALGGGGAASACERLVEAAGLKTIFGVFMRTRRKERSGERSAAGAGEKETLEHLLGVFASLLRHTAPESPARIRTLAKFVEGDYEKIGRLVEVKREYAGRLARVEKEIAGERLVVDEADQAEMEAEWFSRRLDAGLFAGQTVDVVLGWLVAEDAGAATRIRGLLGGLAGLAASLREQVGGVDVESGAEGVATQEMLEALLRCLEGADAGEG